MVFNIIEFSNYEVTKGGIVYNRYHKPVRRKWLGDHIYVTLNDTNNKIRTVRVDKLVYQTYIENPQHDYELEHIDGNQANCKLENLKYININKEDETIMKLIFEGTQQQIKQEMEDWLNELNKQESLKNVSTKLSQHNLWLTPNENDVLPISVVKQTCQLEGHDWKVFKQELQTCGVKEKRTSKACMLTNLELIKED